MTSLLMLLLIAQASPTPLAVPTPHYECQPAAPGPSPAVWCCERVYWRVRWQGQTPIYEAESLPAGCVR